MFSHPTLHDEILVEAASYVKALTETNPEKYTSQLERCAEVKKGVPFIRRAITPLAIAVEELEPGESRISNKPIAFDLDGLKRGQKWNWITPKSGWLVWDPDHTGEITSGKQLFGSVTFWVFWNNGYEVLAALDDDGNGWVDGRETEELGLWVDANMNGISEKGEVLPLHRWNIEAISREHQTNGEDVLWNPKGARLTNGDYLKTYDFVLSPIN